MNTINPYYPSGHSRVLIDPQAGVVQKNFAGAGTTSLHRELTMTTLARHTLKNSPCEALECRRVGETLETPYVADSASLEQSFRAQTLPEELPSQLDSLGKTLGLLHQKTAPLAADPERPMVPPLSLRDYVSAPAIVTDICELINRRFPSIRIHKINDRRHAMRFIHGDFKPDNVLIQGDRIVLIDWERSGLGNIEHDLASWLAAVLTYRLIVARRRASTEQIKAANALAHAWSETWHMFGTLVQSYTRVNTFDAELTQAMAVHKFVARAEMLAFQASQITLVSEQLLASAAYLASHSTVMSDTLSAYEHREAS